MRWSGFLLTLILIISCSESPTETEPEVINLYNLQIELIAENIVELNWQITTADNPYLIAKKNGEIDWIENYRELAAGTTSFLDTVDVQSFMVYSYYLQEMADEVIIGTSDTVACFSTQSIPTEFTAEQIKQDSIRLSWHDNSYGEFFYGIDRKIGNGVWQQDHLLYEPENPNYYNSYMSCVDHIAAIGDTIYYRICIVNGISHSEQAETSIYTSLLAPDNLRASIEGNAIKLHWTDNCLSESGFKIERKLHNGEFQAIAEVGSNITTYLDSELEPDLIYYYRVQAFSPDFSSNYSNTVIGNIEHDGNWVPLDFPTIQAAIDASYSWSELVILPGTYYENVQVNDKYPEISSLYSLLGDEEYIEQTVIDGNQEGSVFAFVNCDSGTPSISGLTLQNGSGNYSNVTGSGWYYYSGGGILCENSDITISNMIIKDNITEIGGGLACLQNSNCTIENTTISNNRAFTSLNNNGGGIYCSNSELIIEGSSICYNNAYSNGGGILITNSIVYIANSNFSSNYSGGGGGGISITSGSEVTLENLLINNNTARAGGGLGPGNNSPTMRNLIICGNNAINGGGICFSSYHEPVIENILLLNNTADYGAGIYSSSVDVSITNVTAYGNIATYGGGALYSRHYADPIIMNCIFWNNSPQEIMLRPGNMPSNEGTVTILYSDIEGGWENISSLNPNSIYWLEGNLVTDPFFLDPGNDDFHLQTDSPCIDAGNPAREYRDTDGTRNDMGTYGGPNCDL
jgi:hypothetical protein